MATGEIPEPQDWQNTVLHRSGAGYVGGISPYGSAKIPTIEELDNLIIGSLLAGEIDAIQADSDQLYVGLVEEAHDGQAGLYDNSIEELLEVRRLPQGGVVTLLAHHDEGTESPQEVDGFIHRSRMTRAITNATLDSRGLGAELPTLLENIVVPFYDFDPRDVTVATIACALSDALSEQTITDDEFDQAMQVLDYMQRHNDYSGIDVSGDHLIFRKTED